MGEYSYILEQQGKTTSEKLVEFTSTIGWRDELATYRIAQDEYEMRAAAAAEQGISLLDEPPYTAEELAALDAESAAYYEAFAANYVATAAFTGSGSGTQSDPYIITNRAELESMADDLTAYYQLANDIDLGGSSSPWTPIGTNSAPFAGSLDGRGYTIQNLYISSSDSYQGLFGVWRGDGLYINNLGVSGTIDSPSANSCGLVIGWAKVLNSQINCCWATGTVSCNERAGGLSGVLGIPSFDSVQATSDISILENCYFSGTVRGGYSSGGFAGEMAFQITNCYADGTLTMLSSRYGRNGGIIGAVNIIEYVSTPNTMSGIVALQTSISGTSPAYGRAWGAAFSYASPSWYDQISSLSAATAYANAEMVVNGNTVSGGTTTNRNGADVSASTYNTQAFWQNTLGWDFDTVWYWDSTSNLPKLRAFLHGPTISSVSATPTTGGVDTEITLSATVQDATSYQWQYSANSGGTWQDITGATAATATWTPGAVGTYQVQLLATNSDGTTTSDPVTVTIYPSPTISDVTIYPNPSDESATFLMSVTVNES